MPGRNLTRDEAAERARVVRVRSYEVELDLTRGARVFGSATALRFAAAPGACTFVDLLAARVLGVELNGRELPVDDVLSDGRIAIGPLAADNLLRVRAEGLYSRTGEGLHRFVDPVDDEVYTYTQFEVADARRVFACFDQPDLKATFAFTVTVPLHWTVISTQPPLRPAEIVADRAIWQFGPTPPLSTYVTAVLAGPYQGLCTATTSRDGRTVPLGVHCRGSLVRHLDAPEVAAIAVAGLRFYEDLFDRAYPFAHYDQVFVPEFNAAAMENAGAVTIAESSVFRAPVPDATRERRAVTILHELAHMWFGDLVTMRWWDDLWLNESFAEYVSTLAAAATTRWSGAWATFSAREKSWAYQQDQLTSTHPVVADLRDLEDVAGAFDGITYAKGASVLRQLVAWVGQDAFVAGVRAYVAAHAWGSTSLADLLTELERASGRDLSAWSTVWLEQAGVTLLHPELVVAAGVVEHLAILQDAPPEYPVLRPHRLAVGGYDLVDGRLERCWQVQLDVAGARTPVPQVVGRPRPAVLLLNDDDLTYARVRLDLDSMRQAVTHRATLRDPVARALVWGLVWDATREAQVAATAFVAAVADAVPTEPESSLVSVMLRQVATTLDLWVAPEHRGEVADWFAARMLGLAADPANEHDVRHQALRAAARHVRDGAALTGLADLFAGRLRPPGLELDPDLRWELLVALVAGGQLGVAQIDAELARDPSAAGVRHAAIARAAVPSLAAKAVVWASVVVQGELTNAQQAAATQGFARAPADLLRPFVGPYFDSIRTVWATRSGQAAQGVVDGLFPYGLAGDPQVDLLATTDAWLTEHTGAPPALRRMVAESRDTVRRALRAQAVDRAARG